MTDLRSQKTRFNRILEAVEQYYAGKIRAYGASSKGVDWNSRESQELRFKQLLSICDHTEFFLINDYGCGYGALVEYMIDRGFRFQYRGFDISGEMIAKANELHDGVENCRFFSDESQLSEADYTIASGIFNVKLQTSNEEWQEYILHTLNKMHRLSSRGFAFNVLTKYSDRDHMRPDLYYADPLALFDYCKSNFSQFISLLHDYALYEFTILVKK
jgi:SAM-dependent methyltransferase